MERRNTREAMSEAASRELDFDPATRAKMIRDTVARIEVYQTQNKTIEEIKQLEPEFVEKYKNLFEAMTSTGGYNKQSLKSMLAMLDHMAQGKITQHQASMIVGQRLAETYIKPVTGSNG